MLVFVSPVLHLAGIPEGLGQEKSSKVCLLESGDNRVFLSGHGHYSYWRAVCQSSLEWTCACQKRKSITAGLSSFLQGMRVWRHWGQCWRMCCRVSCSSLTKHLDCPRHFGLGQAFTLPMTASLISPAATSPGRRVFSPVISSFSALRCLLWLSPELLRKSHRRGLWGAFLHGVPLLFSKLWGRGPQRRHPLAGSTLRDSCSDCWARVLKAASQRFTSCFRTLTLGGSLVME